MSGAKYEILIRVLGQFYVRVCVVTVLSRQKSHGEVGICGKKTKEGGTEKTLTFYSFV